MNSILDDNGGTRGIKILELVDIIIKTEKSHLADVFLLTHKTFTTSKVLLMLLIDKYHFAKNQIDQSSATRIISIFKTWIREYTNDFTELKDIAIKFASDLKLSKEYIDKLEGKNIKRRSKTQNIPTHIHQIKQMYYILNTDVAAQLTLIYIRLFKDITPRDFLTPGSSPSIIEFNNYSTRLTNHTISEILKESDITKRQIIIEYYISIIEQCQTIGNMEACNSIFQGVTSPHITRLVKTQLKIPDKCKCIIRRTTELFSSANNYAKLRDYHKTRGGIIVPLLRMFTNDLLFFDNTFSDLINSEVNFYKRKVIYDTIERIKRYQNKTVNIDRDANIAHYLDTIYVKAETNFEEQSLRCEPNIEESHSSIIQKISDIVFQEYTKNQCDRLNIMLGGVSGVGKSAIIKAIFNVDIKTGHGSPQTQHIEKYEWSNSPLTIYDVPGIEFGQEEKYFKEIQTFLDNIESSQDKIHCIWYVMAASGARVQEREIEMIKKLYGRTDAKGNPRYKLFILLNKVDTETKDNIEIMINLINNVMNAPFVPSSPQLCNRSNSLTSFGSLDSLKISNSTPPKSSFMSSIPSKTHPQTSLSTTPPKISFMSSIPTKTNSQTPLSTTPPKSVTRTNSQPIETKADCSFYMGTYPIVANRNMRYINLESFVLPAHWGSHRFQMESPSDDSLLITFTEQKLNESLSFEITKTQGLTELIEQTKNVLDDINKTIFINTQFVSLKMKDTAAKLIIKKNIVQTTKSSEAMMYELMNLWRTQLDDDNDTEEHTTLRQRIYSFIKNIIVNNNRKILDIISMAAIGIATHDFLRDIVITYWKHNSLLNTKCIIKQNEYINYSEKLQVFREHIDAATDVEFLNSYIDQLWNENTPDSIVERNEIEMFKYNAKKQKDEGNIQEAINIYTNAIKKYHMEPSFHANLSHLFIEINKFDDALFDAHRTIELSPNWYVGHLRRGIALLCKHFFFEAMTCFEKCIELGGTDIEIRAKLNEAKKGYARTQYDEALHHMANNNIVQATECATRAIENDPVVSDYYNVRSLAYKQRKDYSKSKADAKMVIKLSPTNADGYIRLIESYIDNNELPKAYATVQNVYNQFCNDNRLLQLAGQINECFTIKYV